MVSGNFWKNAWNMTLEKQGLYLPEFEHDNCGAGFICSLKGKNQMTSSTSTGDSGQIRAQRSCK